MMVKLNGVEVGELGTWESISAKAFNGQNVLTIGYSGLTGSFRDPHTRRFKLKPGQKRYFTLRDRQVDWLGTRKIQSLEVTEDEFFKNVKRKK